MDYGHWSKYQRFHQIESKIYCSDPLSQSTNGTFLNESRLTQKTEVKENDLIGIGKC